MEFTNLVTEQYQFTYPKTDGHTEASIRQRVADYQHDYFGPAGQAVSVVRITEDAVNYYPVLRFTGATIEIDFAINDLQDGHSYPEQLLHSSDQPGAHVIITAHGELDYASPAVESIQQALTDLQTAQFKIQHFDNISTDYSFTGELNALVTCLQACPSVVAATINRLRVRQCNWSRVV